MTHRKVDISAQAPMDTPEPQNVPILDWVDLDRLSIDEDYQRPLATRNWSNIRRIAGAFDWARFTPVMVAPMEGGDLR